jgi:GNAT superfamily N-acetyltransferase
MTVDIREIREKRALREFIKLPWYLYRDDPNWVPPLKQKQLKELAGRSGLFLAYRDGRAVGRICVSIDAQMNTKKNRREGCISLFESVDDREVAEALFDQATNWLRERQIDTIKGPASANNGDDQRGLLVQGFDGPPVIMTSYNPPYYQNLMESYGFAKYEDYYAYYMNPQIQHLDALQRFVEFAVRKYGFYLSSVKASEITSAVREIKAILDTGMPEEWADLTPPSLEEIQIQAEQLRFLYRDGDLQIAHARDHRPIGYLLAMGDYNQVLKKLNGSLSPLGMLKFLWYRRKITGARVFNLFVIPEYEKRGVAFAMLLNFYRVAIKRGYLYGEGSTIGENNLKPRKVVEKAGGRLYRIYRVYQKQIRTAGN